ncbi:MAG TPA: serine/threonine-protein kinase [Thermoanaerobaculia bacterium]|nr:serine/threonine-protein kinase [Thermoanaerobaculia bacterium]
MIGRVVGNYRIVEKVGEGGMGAVYQALDVMLDREVAIKAIRPDLSREPQIVERFRSEAKILARVSHPAIATIYSFFYENEELFLAMEFVRGRSLSKVLEAEGAIPWPRAVPLFRSALDGIAAAHREGIVHRDLKPDNLMLTEGGRLKVMDFGIARVAGSSHLTRTGLLVGTLRYMAPEQIKGEEVDQRTDVYALGVVLYQMLTGRVPFEGASDFAILRAQIEDSPVPPGNHVPDLPGWLERAVLRALEKDPAQRFQTVAELDDALTRGEPTRLGAPAPTGPVDDDPTVYLPRTPTPLPAIPSPPPPFGPPTVASTAPPPPPPAQSSYHPVELRRPGRGKAVLGIAAVLFVLAVTGVLFLFPRGETPEEAAPADETEALTSEGPVQASTTAAAQPSVEPAAVEIEPAAQKPPVPAPVVPPRERPAPTPREEEEEVPGASFQPAESPAPAEPEPAQEEETSPPAPAPEPAGDDAADLRGPTGELVTASANLYALFETYLEQKEDAGGEITDADEKLQEELEALEDAAGSLNRQLKDGVFARLRGRDAQKRRAEVARRGRELVAVGQRVDALMIETRPSPEVRQAWGDLKRRCQRIAQMAGRPF